MKKHKLRTIFETHMKENLKAKKAAVLLSSGLDGLVSALAAHDQGVKIHAFTFQMGDVQSFDSKHAEIVASKMGWDFTLIKVPTDVKTIAKMWKYMHANLQCAKKRDYECTYPMIYCYEAIRKAGYKYVISGLVADAYFLFNRNTHIQRISGPKSDFIKFEEFRKDYFAEWLKSGAKGLSPENNPSAALQHELLSKLNGLTHVNPWLDKKTYKFFMGKTWQELNIPKQKQDVVAAFADHIERVGHRPHRGYQTEAKVPMYFEQLLADKKINFNGRKRIMDVARDWCGVARS